MENGYVGWSAVEFPKTDADDNGKENQIPVGYKLLSKDFCHVACSLIAEFVEHGKGGALASELEIDAVDEVEADAESVDDGVEPMRYGVESFCFLVMERKQEKYHE